MHPTHQPSPHTCWSVAIIGGGIHGVGILHDLASRGVTEILLVEKNTLGSGTSSRSTKLIHGGLRYLRRLRDFGLVRQALLERRLLMEVAPHLVYPVELILPILKSGGEPAWKVRLGLTLYDRLAGKAGLAPHQKLTIAACAEKTPILATGDVDAAYAFWDGQTDDLGLVQLVATAAAQLGGHLYEHTAVAEIHPTEHPDWGPVWRLDLAGGSTLHARYVVNATGPWANRFLNASGLTPACTAVNNKGAHLLLRDLGLRAGLFLQSPADQRIFFLLPWMGKTLLGTTEELFNGDPDQVDVTSGDIDYLLGRCNRYLQQKLHERDIEQAFAGLRWLAVDGKHSISATSREFHLAYHHNHRAELMTLYGGKLTSYRALAATAGERIVTALGLGSRPSRTHLASAWPDPGHLPPAPDLRGRFTPT